jgi:large subunit ribosomal protein L2
MALMTFKPTSPGRRSMVRVVTPGLHKGAPHAALVEKQGNSGGRNHHGRITTRHIGGGHKQHYRIIDFKRDKEGIAARVERIEYDPNRTAHIALLCYVDGERRYIIAPKGLKAGDQVIAGRDAPIKAGNTLPLRNIPVGSTVHCIEMKPGKGAQIARAAGAGVQLVAREGVYAMLRLRSGEMRKVPADCRATIGEVGNDEHNLEKLGKAGAKRWRGVKPTVRGAAMNPVDHPQVAARRRLARATRIRSPRGACRPRVTRPARTSARSSSSCATAGANRQWHVHSRRARSSITTSRRRWRPRAAARSRSRPGRVVPRCCRK